MICHAPHLNLEPHELELASLLKDHYWLTTSGSTRKTRRWIALSKDAVRISAQAVNSHLSAGAQDVWLRAIPSYHVGGLALLTRAELSRSRAVVLDDWSTEGFLQLAEQSKATLSALVPTQIFDLVQKSLVAPQSLRAIVVGGGALSPRLYQQARQLGWPLLPSFGMTECASQIATASLESLQQKEFPSLQIMSHVQVRTSTDQRLHVKSDALLTAWAEWTGQTWQLTDPKLDGWLQTEDRAELEGRSLRPLGRTGDQVKILGRLVNLSELEQRLQDVLARFPQLGATLLSSEEARREHSLNLVVEGQGEGPNLFAQAEALQAAFNEDLQPFERSRNLYLVSSLPRTALGKIARTQLAEQLGL